MVRKHGAIVGVVLGLAVILVLPAIANDLTGASATADCHGYTLTVNAINLTMGKSYTINFTFTLTCGGVTTTVPGSIFFTASGATATESATGTWLPFRRLDQELHRDWHGHAD